MGGGGTLIGFIPLSRLGVVLVGGHGIRDISESQISRDFTDVQRRYRRSRSVDRFHARISNAGLA